MREFFEAVHAYPVVAFLTSVWVIILVHAVGSSFGSAACGLVLAYKSVSDAQAKAALPSSPHTVGERKAP